MLLNFHGKVAIITGAARGLGREYALLLASRGAAIIVNDLGGGRDGTGKSFAAADSVVKEIQERGGQAVADYNSVEEGEKIVQTAIDNFGRIDILINNAGILRDKSLMKMTAEDFDLVHRVHLRGSFLTTKAAWPYFRQQNYGRIIMTASPSGIYGNFGQANYSSAKLGLLALAKTLAIEGSKYDIKCNTIVPVAASRLTEDLLPEEIFNLLKPSCVAPMVGYLCHESCQANGEVIEAAGGYFGRYQWQRSKGKIFIDTDRITIEDIHNNWSQITDMSNGSTNPTGMEDHTVLLMTQLRGDDIPEPISTNSETQSDRVYINLTVEDAILYALSVGVSTEEPNHLRYLYENDENFSILPSMATTISLNAVYRSNILEKVIEQYKLEDNLMRTLHGEQYLRIYEQITRLPITLACETKILDVLDKGSSGALIIIEVTTFDNNLPIFYNQLSFFMIGSGNFGGKRHTEIPAIITTENVPNDRPPDWIIAQPTTNDQAAMFRLCGDKNPLHIDSNFSKIAGFNQPILHGLCALGFATRHIVAVYADYDCHYFDSIKVRFTGTIKPGQTIETLVWKSDIDSFNDQNIVRIHFECFVRETGVKIISSSFVDLKTPLPKSPKMADFSSDKIVIAPGTDIDCKVNRIFDEKIRPRIAKHSELIPLINTVCQFNITRQGKLVSVWILDLKNGNGEVYHGPRSDLPVECILTVEDDALVDIFEGRDEPMLAFIGGRLQVSGNITAAQKLQQLWSEDEPITPMSDHQQSKDNHPVANNNDDNDQDDEELLRSIPTTGLKSDIMFTIIRNRMHEEPEIMKRLTASYQFNILLNGQPKTVWSAENKTNPTGCVYNKPFMNGKPDCMLTAEDDDLIKLMFGKLNPQRAFMMGKLKVKGNILLLQRLYSLWLELQKMGKTPELPFITDLMSKTDLKPGLRSEMMIVELIQRLIRLPYLCKEIPTLIGFEIFKDGQVAAEYKLDFGKNDRTGVFDRGLPESESFAIMTMTDNDFVRLTYHRFTLEQACKSGRVKIRGDHSIIPKISIIFKTPTSRVKL